jgi:hypothetical protein
MKTLRSLVPCLILAVAASGCGWHRSVVTAQESTQRTISVEPVITPPSPAPQPAPQVAPAPETPPNQVVEETIQSNEKRVIERETVP